MPARTSRAPVVVRELRWEDFPGRMQVYFSLWDEVKENPDLGMTLNANRPTETDEVGWFAELYRQVRRGTSIAVVGEVDGRPVGMAAITPSRLGGEGSETAHVGILGILVDRAYRGRGVGEAILLRALELARARFEIVRLTVFSVNVRARQLYERVGFRPCGRLEREVKRDGRYLDEELMSLDLQDWSPPSGRSTG